MNRKVFLLVLLSFNFLFWQCSSENEENYDNLSPSQRQLAIGEKVYKQYCRSCHGADGKMGLSGAKDLSESQMDLEQRKLIIANGKNTMTPFKNILSEEQVQAVAKYTLTLSDDHE